MSNHPKRILIDLHAQCNLKCPKCLVYGESKDTKLVESIVGVSIDDSLVSSIADQLKTSKPMIGPALWSEPLINPKFKEHIETLRNKDLPISLNTNGLLLTRSICEFLLEKKIDSICISIDAISDETLQKTRGIKSLQKIENNVRRLMDMRTNLGLQAPRVGVSFTLEPSNQHEEIEFIQRWIDIIDFVRIGKVFDGSTFREIEDISDQSLRKPCPALYSTMAIQASGNVSICCLDAYSTTSVGNIKSNSISAIWNGSELQDVRNKHEANDYSTLPLCRYCQRWKSYEYEETIENNILIRSSPEYTYYNRLDRMNTWSSSIAKEIHSNK